MFSLKFSSEAYAASFSNPASVIIVVGAPGESEFGSNFVHAATLWQEACVRADCRCLTLGLDSDSQTNDFMHLERALIDEPKEGLAPFWLVLVGHGTFDGKEARFNLRGPDVTGSDLAKWLRPFTRPMAVVDSTSCSAPLLSKLSGTNRVVVTATRTGNEQYYVHFGTYLAEAIANPEADLDKDGQVSVLEAFLYGSRRTAQFYKTEGRIATEHALLDDNGDNLGTPADWFRGLHATKKAKDNAGLDGLFAAQFCLVPSEAERGLTQEQRARRDALERAVLVFREKKGALPDDDYYGQLEKLLLDLARFYAANISPGASP
ncbi:MAG TPA: hypothetical protein VL361_03175 [Candidatus Limnocylindrales bacterium]|nr:hypothetical protein [Candidatus Limnocylindrales bacterium]